MYYVFERLNTGGTPLRPQEIRNCVFSGDIVQKLRELNELPNWRLILGRPKPEKHQRDVEILLRVFSFYAARTNYEKPMKSFLNKSMAENRNAQTKSFKAFEVAFPKVCKTLIEDVGDKPFHVRGPINLAALDSIFHALLPNANKLPCDLAEKISDLLNDDKFKQAIFFNTSDASVVEARMKIAVERLK